MWQGSDSSLGVPGGAYVVIADGALGVELALPAGVVEGGPVLVLELHREQGEGRGGGVWKERRGEGAEY